MGCGNKKLPINVKQMKNILLKEIDYIIDDKLYFLDVFFDVSKEDKNNYENKIKKFKDSIIKEIKNKIGTDNFIYNIMDNDHCTYKHKRGKKDGEFCCKKITKNGDNKKFVCTVHNRDHKPIKKIKPYEDISLKDNISIPDNIKNTNDNISDSIINNNKMLNTKKNICFKNDKIKKPNIYKKGFNIKLFDNILRVYNSNIICKYRDENKCNNIVKYGACDYKHLENKLFLNDCLDNNIYQNKSYNNKLLIC
jgi:hypothetical protein